MSQNEYVFAVVLKGKGNSPEDAWQNAVVMLTRNPGECPNQWMIEDDQLDDEEDLMADSFVA
jgi:hypothetical protein